MSDLHDLFIGEDKTWLFLLECGLRAVLMFVFALGLMKVSGKKEVRQFSVLELMVIIGLGSALGDPMIYAESPLLPSLVAISVVLLCYWGLNKWTNRSPAVERFVEGKVTRVLYGGILDLSALNSEGMSPSEFFGDLRGMHVEHLGQVKSAYVEIDGNVSVFFRDDADVISGLPLAPEVLHNGVPRRSLGSAPCCCARCGSEADTPAGETCPACGGDAWVRTVDFKRVS